MGLCLQAANVLHSIGTVELPFERAAAFYTFDNGDTFDYAQQNRRLTVAGTAEAHDLLIEGMQQMDSRVKDDTEDVTLLVVASVSGYTNRPLISNYNGVGLSLFTNSVFVNGKLEDHDDLSLTYSGQGVSVHYLTVANGVAKHGVIYDGEVLQRSFEVDSARSKNDQTLYIGGNGPNVYGMSDNYVRIYHASIWKTGMTDAELLALYRYLKKIYAQRQVEIG